MYFEHIKIILINKVILNQLPTYISVKKLNKQNIICK